MSIKAMKQALDALELCNGAETADGIIIYTDKEIASVRQAIEAAERQEPRGYFTVNDYDMLEQITGTEGTPLYELPLPCQTCQALARAVMMDQKGTA
jgi:hypothetical protein